MGESVNRYRSIITRLTLMVTGILATAVLVVGSLDLLGQHRRLGEALAAKAATLAQFMAQVIPLSILSLNFVEMNNNVKKVVLTDDEAVYAVILNEQGIELVSFFKETDPLVTNEVSGLMKNRKPLAAIEAMKRTGRILEVTAPITAGEKRIGSATLGFSTEKMRRALLTQITLIGAILVAIIGLSIALLRVVLRRILHPVQALTTAATQISTGNLNVVLTGTDRTDELGVLSRAFESMASQLRGLITGLEQREYDLHRLTLFQRTILDNAAHGIVSAAPDGVVSSFNPAAERLLGYTADEVVGKLTPASWHDPEEVARRALELSEELGETIPPGFDVFAARPRRNLPEENEWTFIRKEGTRVPVLLSVTALRGENGQITGFVGLTYDLTERKRTEEERRESEAKYRRIVDTATEGIWVLGPDTMTTFINARMAEMLGCSSEEMIGRPLTDFMFEEDAPDHRRKMEERRRGLSESYERRFLRSDGKTVWTLASATPVFDADHTFQGSFAMFTDITERKLAEESLWESSQMLKLVLDNMPAFVFWKDRNSVYLGCNYLFAANAGLSPPEEIIGMTDLDLPWKYAEAESYRADDRSVMETGIPKLNYEETQHTADGRVTLVRTSKIPLRSPEGDVIGVLGTFEDITERKQAEAELRKLNEELERRVIERTADLNNRSGELSESQQALMNIVEDLNLKTEELEQANTKLKEIDRLKSMFIASMSHELRTPLNSIIGFSSVILNEWIGPVNAEQKENLGIIHRSGKHLLNLINDVIDVSKIEAGRIETRSEEFDLYDLLTEAVQYVEKDLQGKGLELHLEIDHHPLCTDKRRLLQCVINLLSNAVKFTEHGEVTISSAVSAVADIELGAGEHRPSGAASPLIDISIKDSGIGIAKEDIPRLFEAFVRLESPLKTTAPGTGLGLYLTRKLVVDVLGGDILCNSTVGMGSTFTLRIPERKYEKGTGSRG